MKSKLTLTTAEQAATCPNCESTMRYPIDWRETEKVGAWAVDLRCPNCEVVEPALMADTTIDEFDRQLDADTLVFERSLQRLTEENMAHEIAAFTAALECDQILPEDF